MKKQKNPAQINEFMKLSSFALYGASSKKKKFGNYALESLLSKRYKVFPIHKTAWEIDGIRAYNSVFDLPIIPDGAILIIPPEEAEHAVNDIIQAGIKNIWFQQGAGSSKALRFCQLNGINVVNNECILMFLDEPGFPHNIHKWVWSIGAGRKTKEMAS